MTLKDLGKSSIYTCLVAIFLLVTFCEKPERYVRINTGKDPSDISYTSVILKGEVTDLGSKPIDDHGIMISENSTPRFGNARVESLGPLTAKGPFQVTVTGLTKNTLYYFRAYVTVDGTDIFSELTFSFRTKDTESPGVTAGTIADTTMTSASLAGEVVSDGGEPVSGRGLCWGTSPGPSLSACLDTTVNGSGTGQFAGTMLGLTPGTQYYVRAYAINAKGTAYSPEDIVFTTHNLPQLTTRIVTNVTNSGAMAGGEITSDGGVSVKARGVVWGTSSNPEIALTTKTLDGSANGPYESTISGLIPGTAYFVRAYATNKYGTSYGNELQFTTTKPSEAVTLPAELIGNTTVTLKGSVNANGFAANATFEYGETTAYGSIADAVPSIVSGNSAETVIANLTGLLPGKEYHFRIKAVNAGGTSQGDDMTFRTTDSPIPVTGPANSITNTTATLTGSVNANGSETSVSFEYGTSSEYGTTIPGTPGTVTGNGSTAVTGSLTGLTQGTLYHYRVKAVSVGGTTYGSDATFTTTRPPDATTLEASSISNTSATLNATVNAHGLATTVKFEYGTTTSYGTEVEAEGNPFSGGEAAQASKAITGLTPGTIYHFRVKAESAGGTVYGSDRALLTPEPPAATTEAATAVGNTTATLNGSVNARDLSTSVTFQYGLTASYGTTADATPGTVTGSSTTAVSYNLGGLTPGTTYHFRVVATSEGGTTDGADRTFTTTEPPVATTGAATSISTSAATLNGMVNAKDLSTVVTFEYGSTTAYGETANAAESPVNGATNSSVSAAISSLSPSTTYHFRVKAVSSGGTVYGDDSEFTTAAVPLTVTDYDGNIYNTIKIGTQVWMKENLSTTSLNDGTPIANITDDTQWSNSTSAAYCWWANSWQSYGYFYGALYNWYAVGTGKLCPAGWHVPSDDDWTTLEIYLQNNGFNYDDFIDTDNDRFTNNKIAKALASATSHWHSTTTEGAVGNTDYPEKRNITGFTALPGGYGGVYFDKINEYGWWWSSTVDGSNGFARRISYAWGDVERTSNNKNLGFSVRCLRDY